MMRTLVVNRLILGHCLEHHKQQYLLQFQWKLASTTFYYIFLTVAQVIKYNKNPALTS